MSNEFNFIHSSLPETDKDLFFGPIDSKEQFIEFDDSWTMAHILVEIGVFKSLTEARKNNSAGSIPLGWTAISRGKGPRLKRLFILNKF